MMQKKRISELSPQLVQLFERARSAAHGRNFHYAVEMLTRIVHEEPGCLDARRMLRAAQVDRVGGRLSPLRRVTAFLRTAYPLYIRGPKLIKQGRIEAALDLGEYVLRMNPTSRAALHFLARAAAAGGLDELATVTLEFCLQHHPTDESTLRALVDHCKHIGQGARAVAALKQLLRGYPDDLQLQNELKQVTATATMEKDKWDEAQSFREMVRDREKAERLEREERIAHVQEEDVLETMIAEAREDVEKAPSSVPFKRRLATLFVQAKQFDDAIAQYEEVLTILGRDDPTIRDCIIAASAARYDDAIRRWRQYSEGNPTRQEEAEREIVEIEKQKQAFLAQSYAERVQKYPNEHTYHYEYGQICFEMGDFDTALKEFQFARQNRHLHVRCLVYIGRCMAAKGIDDLAAEQLATALERGDQRLDRDRLGIIYDLAILHERLGQEDEYARRLKEIYAVDVAFRDVAERLERTYHRKAESRHAAAL